MSRRFVETYNRDKTISVRTKNAQVRLLPSQPAFIRFLINHVHPSDNGTGPFVYDFGTERVAIEACSNLLQRLHDFKVISPDSRMYTSVSGKETHEFVTITPEDMDILRTLDMQVSTMLNFAQAKKSVAAKG